MLTDPPLGRAEGCGPDGQGRSSPKANSEDLRGTPGEESRVRDIWVAHSTHQPSGRPPWFSLEPHSSVQAGAEDTGLPTKRRGSKDRHNPRGNRDWGPGFRVRADRHRGRAPDTEQGLTPWRVPEWRGQSVRS